MRSLSIFFCLVIVLTLTAISDAQTTFTNNTAIPIADGSDATGSGVGSPYPSAITVSGLTGTVTDVNVSINSLTHSYPDDVGFMLVAPNGAFMAIQTDIGGRTSVTNVTYTFDDQAASEVPDAGPLTAGTFRPTSIADDDFFPQTGTAPPPQDCQPTGSGECPQASPAGSATLNGTFGGINPNGTWKLYAIDCCEGDTGTVNGGWSLSITTSTGGTISKAPLDFNGDNRTDWVVVRNTGGGASGQVNWFVAINGGVPLASQAWGIASDYFLPADFDGDGKADYVVWRPGAQGQFFILSSQTFTFRVDPFGTTGDDPTVIGDYNGDRITDVAVYRRGPTPGTPATWFYRTAPNTNFVAVNFGQSNGNTCGSTGDQSCGDYPAPGDYDGDGKNDFVVQRDDGAGRGVFYKLLTTNVFTAEVFGNATDAIVPGDYDGDGKTDIATVRSNGTNLVWSYEPSGTPGSTVVSDTWGVASTDFPTQGDYNGDGRTDYAIWRSTTGVFYVFTTGSRSIFTQTWGTPDDYPVANFNVH